MSNKSADRSRHKFSRIKLCIEVDVFNGTSNHDLPLERSDFIISQSRRISRITLFALRRFTVNVSQTCL